MLSTARTERELTNLGRSAIAAAAIVTCALWASPAATTGAVGQIEEIGGETQLTFDERIANLERILVGNVDAGQLLEALIQIQDGLRASIAAIEGSDAETQIAAIRFRQFVVSRFPPVFRRSVPALPDFPAQGLFGRETNELIGLSDGDLVQTVLAVPGEAISSAIDDLAATEVGEGKAEGEAPPIDEAPPEVAFDDAADATSAPPELTVVLTLSSEVLADRTAPPTVLEERLASSIDGFRLTFTMEPMQPSDLVGGADHLSQLFGETTAIASNLEAELANPAGRDPDLLELRAAFWKDMASLVEALQQLDDLVVVYARPSAVTGPERLPGNVAVETLSNWTFNWAGRYVMEAFDTTEVTGEIRVEQGAAPSLSVWTELAEHWPSFHVSAIRDDELALLNALVDRIDDGIVENDREARLLRDLEAIASTLIADRPSDCVDLGASTIGEYCLNIPFLVFDGPIIAASGVERITITTADEDIVAPFDGSPRLTWAPTLGLSAAFPALRVFGDLVELEREASTGLGLGIPSRLDALSKSAQSAPAAELPECVEELAASLETSTPDDRTTVRRTSAGIVIGGALLAFGAGVSGSINARAAGGWPCGAHAVTIDWAVEPVVEDEPIEIPRFR